MRKNKGLRHIYRKVNELITTSNFSIRNDNKFCFPGCPNLSVTEDNQKKGEPHMCTRYNKQVYHGGFQPNLLKLQECDFK